MLVVPSESSGADADATAPTDDGVLRRQILSKALVTIQDAAILMAATMVRSDVRHWATAGRPDVLTRLSPTKLWHNDAVV